MSAPSATVLRGANHRHAAHPDSLLASLMSFLVPQLRALDRLMSRTSMSLAESRAQLVRMANSLESSEPSHAADLRAAASRHEG